MSDDRVFRTSGDYDPSLKPGKGVLGHGWFYWTDDEWPVGPYSTEVDARAALEKGGNE